MMDGISIVVITYNEKNNIEDCLRSIFAQSFSKYPFEVIVVDGNSTDGTIDIIKNIKKEFSLIKLVVKKSSITEARNLGIKEANYSMVAFTDADCIVPDDWLNILIDGYEKNKTDIESLVGVGGANIPPDDINDFTYAIGIAFDSLLGGMGSIQAQRMKKDKLLDSVSCTNSLYEKDKLLKVGMFSEDLGNQGEDWEIGLKLRKKGYSLLGLKDSYVLHKIRTSPKKFWKNMVFYGDGRMRLIAKHPHDNGLKYYLPLIFIISMIFSGLSILPIYLLVVTFYSLFLSVKKQEMKYFPYVVLVFILLHFGYAFGEVKGLRWVMKK